MKKAILCLVVLIFIAVGCSNNTSNTSDEGNSKDAKVMKFASVAAKDQPISLGAFKFKEIVEEQTKGSVKVEIYTDGQLGGDLEVIDSLRAGTVEATNISTGPIATVAERFSVLDLPFLFSEEKKAYEVLDGPVGNELLQDLPDAGLVGLGYWENGFRYLTNNIREVKSVEDVKGLKLRTMEVSLHIAAWKALGANPTPMAFTELFTALEQNVVDGQEGTYPNMRYNSFHEVQKYFTDTKHVYNASVMLISKKFWDSLTDEEKEVIQKASDEARDYQRELSMKDNAESHKVMEESGMIMTELTPEARQEFVDAMAPVYDQFAKEVDKNLLDRVLEAVK